VKFDASTLPAGTKTANLVVFLHHQFVLQPEEAAQGGHPHAWKVFKNVDVTKGQTTFALDMCQMGTAMWSEENCGFNIVAMLDTTGSHNPDTMGIDALAPEKGVLTKMIPIEISCHTQSKCIKFDLDCADGTACTSYTPPTTCACAADKCPSQDKICK
jgi:hypothetical protein